MFFCSINQLVGRANVILIHRMEYVTYDNELIIKFLLVLLLADNFYGGEFTSACPICCIQMSKATSSIPVFISVLNMFRFISLNCLTKELFFFSSNFQNEDALKNLMDASIAYKRAQNNGDTGNVSIDAVCLVPSFPARFQFSN